MKKWKAGDLVIVKRKRGKLLAGTVVQDQGHSNYVFVAIVDQKHRGEPERWTLFYPATQVRRSRRQDRLDPVSRAWVEEEIESRRGW